jgi:hypothetical protein
LESPGLQPEPTRNEKRAVTANETGAQAGDGPFKLN